MQLVNDLNYPSIMMDALQVSVYHRTGTDYSGTELIRSPRIVQLERRHGMDMAENASSMIKSFIGTAIHDHLEKRLVRVPNKLYSLERRFYATVLDREISGKFDVYYNNTIYDFKTTSVWKTIKSGGEYPDWEKQLNVYAWLLRKNGLAVDALKVIAIYTDWDARKAQTDYDYPKSNIVEIDIPMQTQEFVEEYVTRMVTTHKIAEETPDDQLPLCSDDDMWLRPSSFAVMVPNLKRAFRVVSTMQEAEHIIEGMASPAKGLATIVERPGERVRCQTYCRVAPVCSQYKEFVTNGANAN